MVHLLEQAVPIPRGAEDVALPGLEFLLLALAAVIVSTVVRRFGGDLVVVGHQRGGGVDAVVGQLPPVALGPALERPLHVVPNRFHGAAAVDGVRHGPHHLRVAAKTDGGDGAVVPIILQDDGVRIGGEPYLGAAVEIGQLNQFA